MMCRSRPADAGWLLKTACPAVINDADAADSRAMGCAEAAIDAVAYVTRTPCAIAAAASGTHW